MSLEAHTLTLCLCPRSHPPCHPLHLCGPPLLHHLLLLWALPEEAAATETIQLPGERGQPFPPPTLCPSLPWGVFAVRDLGVWLHPDQTKGSGTHTAAPHPWMHQRWVVPWLGMQAAFLACLVKSWFGWD